MKDGLVRTKMVEDNLDLPRRLYWSRLRWQHAGRRLGEQECVAVGNFTLVESSWQYPDERPAERFRPYAARAIFRAVNLACFRDRAVKSWGETNKAGTRLPLRLYALTTHEERLDPADLEAVMLVMGRLPENDRAYLLDRLVRGLTFRQMADERGISKTNVQKWFAESLARARVLLDHLTGGRG